MCETVKCLPSFMQPNNSCTIALTGVSVSGVVLVGLGALGLLTLEGFLPCALPLIGIGGSMTLSGLITLCVKNCSKGRGSSDSSYETSSSEPEGKSQPPHSSEIKDPPEQESPDPITPIRKTPSKAKTHKKDSPKIPKNTESAYGDIRMKRIVRTASNTPYVPMPRMPPTTLPSHVVTNSSVTPAPSLLKTDHKRNTVYAKGFGLPDFSQSEATTPPSHTSANNKIEKTGTVYKEIPLSHKTKKRPENPFSSTIARKLFDEDPSQK